MPPFLRRRKISIHAPARGATMEQAIAAFKQQFQSTLPRGERQPYYPQGLIVFLFQSTLPRGERLHQIQNKHKIQVISIHAPARGATNRFSAKYTIHPISIHAPARGATFRALNNSLKRLYFNPRSREGSDLPY